MTTVDLRLGDCLEVMKTLPDGCVDAVITDPPYGVGVKYTSYDDTRDNLAKLVLAFMPDALRLARTVLVTCGNGNQHLYPVPTWTLCWHIPAGCGYNKYGFTTWQPILAYGKPYRPGGKAYPDSISMSPRAEDSEHPCNKPIVLMKTIIERYVPPNATVLDPFMGSGTTGVACVQTGRNFIGIEISEQYFRIAKRRIEAAQAQPALLQVAT